MKHEQIHQKKNSGYAILFAVLLVSIILAITIGIANIALKEAGFTATSRDSYLSLFSADSAGECALYHNSVTAFLGGPANPPLDCVGQTGIVPSVAIGSNQTTYGYTGINTQTGCANVYVTINTCTQSTTIESHGFNLSCTDLATSLSNQALQTRRVERVLSYTMLSSNPPVCNIIIVPPPPGGNGA